MRDCKFSLPSTAATANVATTASVATTANFATGAMECCCWRTHGEITYNVSDA